jgi:hypothetical protein
MRYQRLLVQEEQRLWQYQHRSPFFAEIAQAAVFLNMLVNPRTRYRKNYADKYNYT